MGSGLLSSPPHPARGNSADLAFAKIVAKCSSFVIACEGHETTKRGNIFCLGSLTEEQMRAGANAHLCARQDTGNHKN